MMKSKAGFASGNRAKRICVEMSACFVLWTSSFDPALADPGEVPLLNIHRIGGHVVMRTSLPEGRHDIERIKLPSVERPTGFIYTSVTDDAKSVVRIFQIQHRIGTAIVKLRMRAATTVGYYTLFIETTDSNGGIRSAILRRSCCGYQLEIQDSHLSSRTIDSPNLKIMEKAHPIAFARLIAITQKCQIPGIHIDFREDDTSQKVVDKASQEMGG